MNEPTKEEIAYTELKTEHDNLQEAKRSLKLQIEFMESLLTHLKGSDKILRGRATWAAWCIHRYFNDHLIGDIQNAMEKNIAPASMQ